MSKVKNAFKIIGIIFVGLIGLTIELYIIFNITFSIQLNNKIAELKAQGKPMTIAEIVPTLVPDKENAAILYNKAFELMESEKTSEMVKTIGFANSHSNISDWSEKQKVEIPKLVDSRELQRIYELLEEGSQKLKCNFSREYGKGVFMELPTYSNVRNAVRLFCAKALLEAESGKAEKAFDMLLIGLEFSNHLKDEPILISQLVRIACDQLLIECVKSISDSKSIPVEKANLIMSELSAHKDVEPFIKCMDGERLIYMGWFSEKILQGNMSLKALRAISGIDILREDPLIAKMFSSLLLNLYRPIFKKDYTCYLTLISKIQDNYNIPYYKVAEKIRNNPIERQIPRYCVLTRISIPALDVMQEGFAKYQAEIDICRTGLALRIYRVKNGDYPEKLESLVPDFLKEVPIDPFSGENLKYYRYERGFKLYSIGPNMQDDFGTRRTYEKDSPAYENYDIVWEFGS